jgi:hypothetical protein
MKAPSIYPESGWGIELSARELSFLHVNNPTASQNPLSLSSTLAKPH